MGIFCWVGQAQSLGLPSLCLTGGVSEWFKELVLKTSDLHGSVGSNPTPTAKFARLRNLGMLATVHCFS